MLNILKMEDIKPKLINLTGVRLLVIFALLLDAPKTVEEIKNYFENNNYPKNLFSIDTLRNDINALRLAGCDISRADKSNDFKFKLIKQPFEFNIEMSFAKSISKFYNKFYETLTIPQLQMMEKLFTKFAQHADNETTAEYLLGISLIKNINKATLQDLLTAYQNKHKIAFIYNSPNSGKIQINFVIENFEFRSKKLYICGYSLTHQESSFFLVSKIMPNITIYMKKDLIPELTINVKYKLTNNSFKNYIQSKDEKIINKDKNSITLEYKTDNHFKLIQKMLSYGADCEIISPTDFKDNYINTLKEMLEGYND